MSILDWLKGKGKTSDDVVRGKVVEDTSVKEKMRKINLLTPREYETFLILIEGYTLRFAAEQIGVKYPTVNTYMTAIYKKLGISSRVQLILHYKDIRKS